MRITRENVADLIDSGVLPEGSLNFHIRSGAEALPLPALFKTQVRWLAALDTPGAVLIKQSDSFPPFTFYEWNQPEIEEGVDGYILRFLVQTDSETIPVEVQIVRAHTRGA